MSDTLGADAAAVHRMNLRHGLNLRCGRTLVTVVEPRNSSEAVRRLSIAQVRYEEILRT